MIHRSNRLAQTKQLNQNVIAFKSPYFVSVSKGGNFGIKRKGSVQQAVSIQKHATSSGSPKDTGQKKKVFKRFGKFEQINQVKTTQAVQLKNKYEGSEKEKLVKQRTTSNPKDILLPSKTLALVQNFNTFKIITLSTQKLPKQKQRDKKHSFRSKTRSGNTLHWGNKDVSKNSNKNYTFRDQIEGETQDWLCRELIKKQVYGMDEYYEDF